MMLYLKMSSYFLVRYKCVDNLLKSPICPNCYVCFEFGKRDLRNDYILRINPAASCLLYQRYCGFKCAK